MNKITDKYTETFNTWNKVANLYEDKFMNLDLYNTTYDIFCNLIETEKPNILELGCGPGNITKYLISKKPDFNILGLDVSPNMIELANKNNPTANFEVMDVRFIEKIERKFDAIVCGFIIPYLSKKDRKELIENCAKLLTEKGILYLSFVEGKYEHSKYQTGSNGSRMFFYYHELNKIKSELIENDFQILNNEDVEYKKQNGIEIHTVLIAKQNKRKHNRVDG
ncbi:class I SAM-dependent methyltransferase [Polaribacter filamentus]|uniref:class I SAM-dependent methyltransferase n=1 Tax=Polaribacter filamentus TaxID=53483 RepID=UPI001F0C569E|nr:class I SAM-dependent methyltransferase [Polaribacter filamentus]